MAYDDIDSENFLKDITKYKEFYQLHPNTKNKEDCTSVDQNVIPKCLIDKQITNGHYLIPKSYQLFGKIFINPNTSYSRLLIKHNTGSGKTAHALGIAMEFIDLFQQETSIGYHNIGSIFVMGFENSRKSFERELFRYSEFGFVTREEVRVYYKLIKKASDMRKVDIDNMNEFTQRIRRKLSNRKHRGFFKFMGYKAFANRLFITTKNISGMQENEIRSLIKSGEVKINMSLLNTFNNSLIICDEVHNIYNSVYKNNWGVAIQLVLDMVPTVRAVFLSATPINNSPTESVDLINLLIPADKKIDRHDFFDNNGTPKPGAIKKLAALSVGRISYIMDVDAKYFPSRRFIGDIIPGISYLKFTRCQMSKFHENTYNTEIADGSVAIDGQYILDIAFPNPENENVGIYKSSGVGHIQSTPTKWRNTNEIDVLSDNVTITGGFLHVSKIGKYSSKYHKMLTDILDIIKNDQGKIFIYHPLVIMSGVLFIGELLSQNGIISDTSAAASNTICSRCGIENSKHNHTPTHDHKFNAARYIIIHSGIDNKIIERSIERYNTPRNATGQDVMIIIGSRIMQESREVRNTENIMIAHKPDNISALIQIIGRVIRTNSHSDLPENRRNVNIHIYVSSHTDMKKLTYEELKYKEKITHYKTIQQIEKEFHEVAVDSTINHPIINNALTEDDIGDLRFKPKYKFEEIPLSKMRLSTFTVYHTQSELEYIIYIIKRLFLEKSQVWTYDQLWQAVKTSTYNIPVNTHIFSEDNFAIALYQLTWGVKNNVIINDTQLNQRKFLDRLFDQYDRRIILPSGILNSLGNTYGVIVQMDKYYMLFPMDNNIVRIGMDMPYRIFTQNTPQYVNVRSYLERSMTSKSYSDRKLKFKQIYDECDLTKMSNAVCEYGLDFHIQFIEDCINYIFNIWTDPTKTQSEYHKFYFKMIYYYDVIGVVIWANTVSLKIYKMYSNYVLNTQHVAIGTNKLDTIVPKTQDIEKQHEMNAIARDIGNTSCSWCPVATKDIFESSVTSTLDKFAKNIKTNSLKSDNKIIKVDPSSLPIGHMLRNTPHFYLPDSGWFSSVEHSVKKEWIENDIIIGYGDRSKTGVHVRFKLRMPIHKMKKVEDIRKQERGTICSSINKTKLFKIATAIGLDPKKISVYKLCDEIKARLMYLDLEERRKGTNIKWYYHFFMEQPYINKM